MAANILIVGQGLAGTLLSYSLLQRGVQHRVVDQLQPHAASRVAAGLMNPLAGRALAPAAHWDRFMPSAEGMYRALETLLDRSFYHQRNFLTVFSSEKDRARWQAAAEDPARQSFLDASFLDAGKPAGTHSPWGAAVVRGGAQLDVGDLLDAYRSYLQDRNMLVDRSFHHPDLSPIEETWAWEDGLYRAVVFCEGHQAANNPWFGHLPWRPNLGERLLLRIPAGSWSGILRRQGLLAPAPNGLYWLGSANQWDPSTTSPTEKGQTHLAGIATGLLDTAWTAVDHAAAIRPTMQDRHPVVGPHPDWPGLWILNGLGTKGSLWCPWHADRLAAVLAGSEEPSNLDARTLPARF